MARTRHKFILSGFIDCGLVTRWIGGAISVTSRQELAGGAISVTSRQELAGGAISVTSRQELAGGAISKLTGELAQIDGLAIVSSEALIVDACIPVRGGR